MQCIINGYDESARNRGLESAYSPNIPRDWPARCRSKPGEDCAMRRRVLITGAAGEVGRLLADHLRDDYELVLTDRQPPPEHDDSSFVAADIGDFDSVYAVSHAIDTVVHLAAETHPDAPWEKLLSPNIVGLYNVLEAAHRQKCRRVIFASSINAVAGYPGEMQVHTSQPVRPYNLYGATKAWGEAASCFYADQRGLSVLCLRFGWVRSPDSADLRPGHPYLPFVLTYDDLIRLIRAAIEAPATLRFGIFHGVSNNRWKRLDISDTRAVLGYEPQDDAFELAEEYARSHQGAG